MCSNGGIVHNTAYIFRVFVATPRTLSYLCIFSSFYLALNLNIQMVNSPRYSITWYFLFKIQNIELKLYFFSIWKYLSYHLGIINTNLCACPPTYLPHPTWPHMRQIHKESVEPHSKHRWSRVSSGVWQNLHTGQLKGKKLPKLLSKIYCYCYAIIIPS